MAFSKVAVRPVGQQRWRAGVVMEGFLGVLTCWVEMVLGMNG